MRWYMLAVRDSQLVDGPWAASDDEAARAAFERYRAKVATQRDLRPLLLAAESLDDLIGGATHIFQTADGLPLLRGPRNLTTVDRRARMFVPGGLDTSAPMTDEDAIVLMQQRVRTIGISPKAPEEIQRHFVALGELCIYAAFVYDFNAMVISLSALAAEFALGVKFVESYGGRVPLRRKQSDEQATLEVTMFRQAATALRHGGSHPASDGWALLGNARFKPGMAGLVGWAHRRGLFRSRLDAQWDEVRHTVRSIELTRQGDKKWTPPEYDVWDPERQDQWWKAAGRQRWEREYLASMTGMRNTVAHPTMHQIATPVNALESLRWIANLVSVLWPTEAGPEPG